MILSPAMYYVDDYGSMEDSLSANSSFESFEKYNGCLQIAMKPSQRQPPDTAHRIQGVIISSDEDNLILTPCPKRMTSMCQQIDKRLESGTMSPEQACKMAGKCNFLTGRLFGKVGRIHGAKCEIIVVSGGEPKKLFEGEYDAIAFGPIGGILVGRHTKDTPRTLWKGYRGGQHGFLWIDVGSGVFAQVEMNDSRGDSYLNISYAVSCGTLTCLHQRRNVFG
eukprot:s2127_g12.t1